MRRNILHGVWAIVAVALLMGCQGVQPSTGLGKMIRVSGAQLANGRISSANGDAPVQVTAPTSTKSQRVSYRQSGEFIVERPACEA
jgi:hypothetical protein